MANYHQRKRHAGTLTFFLLVPIADVLGASLTYVYGSTIFVWLLFFLRFSGMSVLNFFYHDMLTTLGIGALIAAAIVACIVRVLEGRYLALKWFAYPAIFIVAFWILLRVLFQLQVTASFVPHLPVFPSLDFKDVLQHPNSLAGLVWLIPYGIMHIILRESPDVLPQKRSQERQKKTPPSRQVAHVIDSNLVGEDWEEEETVILNPIWADEEKSQILQACIVKYEAALKRLYPLPLQQLKVPRSFCYVASGTQVVWYGRILVIPQALLDPMNGHRLLPALARALFAYNRMDLWIRPFMSFYAQQGCLVLILAPLGWFLWLPVFVKYALGWNDWRADRVLDADTFAWMLGQGETLLHQLELMRALGVEEPDPYMPTVEERIGHLQGLLNKEHESMRRQGIPQAGPLIGPDVETPNLK